MASRDRKPWSLRPLLYELLPLLQVVAFISVAWRTLSLAMDTPFPIMVVTSESMEPAFQVGDVLLIANHKHTVRVGDLPVCWLRERQFPMIHRVISTYWDLDNRQVLLTKGDNNNLDDSLLYPDGQDFMYRDELVGFVRFYVPFVGWPLILAQSPARWTDLVSRLAPAMEGKEVSDESGSFVVNL